MSIIKLIHTSSTEGRFNESVTYNANGSITSLMWQFDGGYVDLDTNGTPTCWNYYVTDHLGSTRMVVSSNDSIRETINYYPFGSEMRMEAPAQIANSLGHPFRFTGKELDKISDLNTYDYGARQYYSILGRWDRVDPLCEKYYNVSPYAYANNNPVMLIDLYGMEPDSLEAALMAAYSYGDKNKEKYAEQLKGHDWTVNANINSPSGFKATIFSRPIEIDGKKQLEYAIAFAGTDNDIKSIDGIVEMAKDVLADVHNYFGISPSLQQMQAVMSAAAIAPLAKELTYVGHSLGGGLAAFASMVTGKKAITFNPASVNGTAKMMGNIMYGEQNIIQYRTMGKTFLGVGIGGDPVNNFQQNTLRPSQGHIHSVYTNSYIPDHGIGTFVKLFGGNI